MRHRPEYHFMPIKNWMNDPNAPIYFDGEHHLFYQYNPTDYNWGNLHWGHAVSKDLLHWEHKPIALYPAKARGEQHCFSGCSYVRDGKLELFYTSIGPQRDRVYNAEQWVATSDDMINWRQIPDNPVLSNKDNPSHLLEWRDPFVFTYQNKTYAVLAGILEGRHGAIHIYETDDWRKWVYRNAFFKDDTSTVYECPNVIVFGDKLVLIRSIMNCRNVRYLVGTMNEDCTLNVLHSGDIDFGDLFATNISRDHAGRVLMWGWCREGARGIDTTDGAWSGVQAIPRVISLDAQNILHMEPLPELRQLYRSEENVTLDGFKGIHTFNTRSTTFSLSAKINATADFTLRILDGLDSREHTDLVFSPQNGVYRAELAESTLLDTVDTRALQGKFTPGKDGACDIHLIVDNSVAEIFVNGTSCMTVRVYPFTETGRISMLAPDGVLNAHLEVHEIAL